MTSARVRCTIDTLPSQGFQLCCNTPKNDDNCGTRDTPDGASRGWRACLLYTSDAADDTPC
eukprot:5285364-Pyramimonas_sp.AAC.1